MANDNVIDTLNDLIEASKDSEYGFRKSSEYLGDAEIRQFFLSRAVECRLDANELQALVARLGGSAGGAVHRGWIAVQGSISGHSDEDILQETERGEDSAVDRYHQALDHELPPDVRSLLERQFEGVKRNHSRVRALRDRARARNP